MPTDKNLLSKLLHMQKTLFSSLRLKDVLETGVAEISAIAGGAKVALFLSDNDSLTLKLMSSCGYQNASVETLRVLPFIAETLLKQVVQRRQPMLANTIDEAPDLSAAIMKREQSKGQIALPLISSNLLVGALLIDVLHAEDLQLASVLKDVADLMAIAVGNAILFGRSEYERERLGTLYKTSVSLSGSSLKVGEVLQIAADTALILGNTPHCAILMCEPSGQSFHLAAFKGLDGSSFNEFDLGMEQTVAGQAIALGKTQYVSDAVRYQNALPRASSGREFGSIIAVPMVHEHKSIGVILLLSTDQRGFHREQVELLESLAQQLSAALHVALMHESAQSQSIQDAHTGLYNRWHCEDALAKEMERSQRHKHDLALAVIDIDHLSRVNELLGFERGDTVIKHVARIIKSSLRDIDIPCRYGSEEFALILPETNAQSAMEVAERLRQKIRSESAPGIGLITVSIGIASFPGNADSVGALLKSAEEALDVAKFEGRDRVKMTEAGAAMASSGRIAWDELARQAKLAMVSERQSRLAKGLAPAPEYAPWMRATPGWGGKKKAD